MTKTTVKKEKVIKEFRDELNIKGIEDRERYDIPFFKILNELYVFHPREIKCNITRFNSLTFIIIVDHTYIYIEWSERTTLLCITHMDDRFNDGGIFNLTLDDAIEKIKNQWNKKV